MELERYDETGIDKAKNFDEGMEGELDLPPEFCRYRDEGCELADSCLNCPFARCIYDEPGGKQHLLKGWRAKEIARLFTIEGKKIRELARLFNVSQRTVQRALKGNKEKWE
ncbi:MAG: helix-turn-helix domain-containing protein [Dehalococcoidales bacterium]|nr:helix-turn-helix domain-containing protein [Dehalococcoidales bacterium]